MPPGGFVPSGGFFWLSPSFQTVFMPFPSGIVMIPAEYEDVMADNRHRIRSESENESNPGNNQLGRQQGQNTGKQGWKSNVRRQTRNDPGFPKTTGSETKATRKGKGKK